MKLSSQLSRAVSQAYKKMQAGDTHTAAHDLLNAWRNNGRDLAVLRVVGNAMVEMAEREVVFELLGEAIQVYGQTEEISSVMGHLAVRMQQFDAAEQAFNAAIESNPTEPEHYVNLTSAMAKNGRVDDAISLLQQVIPLHPTYAMLWNAIGVLMRTYKQQHPVARTFFEEAHKLDPDNVAVLANLAMGQPSEKAIHYLERALQIDPNNSSVHFSLAMEHLQCLDFAKAWPHYEYRLDANASEMNAPIFTSKGQRWKGEPLAGKTLLVMAEQGIGDEVLFAMNLQVLSEEVGTLLIGCEPRLVTIYQRSFPDAEVGAFEDTFEQGFRYRSFPSLENLPDGRRRRIDFTIPLCSIPLYKWPTPAHIPHISKGYLKPDPTRIAAVRERIAAQDGKLKVGLSWRSGKLDAYRSFGYFGVHALQSFKGLENIVFFSLQYSADPEEYEVVRDYAGLDLVTFDELDLKNDIEANLAIMDQMDLCVGPNIATQMFSLALGKKTWMMTWGRPWWAVTEADDKTLSYAPQSRVYDFNGGSWRRHLHMVCQDLASEHEQVSYPKV